MKAATRPTAAAPRSFVPPGDRALAQTLGPTKQLWDDLVGSVETAHAPVELLWTAAKTVPLGLLRLIRKKRTILYLLADDGFFRVAFVFGERATQAVRSGRFPASVRRALEEARVYPEGRGIRLEVRTAADVETMKRLAAIKLAN